VNGGSDQALPTTATCFSSLSLPPYRNAADALKKVDLHKDHIRIPSLRTHKEIIAVSALSNPCGSPLMKIRYAIHSCVTIDCDGERSGESFVLEDAIAHEGAP